MSHPQDPFWQNPFSAEPVSYDPLGRLPYTGPPDEPLDYPEPPEPPVNTLATLSVLFAFAFAPAGALMAHLGLAQIRRTGERGRDRAIVGMWLSYAFITIAVVTLAGWATLIAIRTTQTAAPTTAESVAAAAPTVAAADLAGLLPGLADVRKITGDQKMATGKTWDHIAGSGKEGQIDRPECSGSISPGTPDAYRVEAVFGYRASEFTDTSDPRNSRQVVAGVAAFRDAPAAQKQLTQLLAGWRQCGGSEVKSTLPSGQILTFSLSNPTDAGNGITIIEVETKGLRRAVRALAAKSNIIIDLDLTYAASGTVTDRAKPAVGIANYILGKIPG